MGVGGDGQVHVDLEVLVHVAAVRVGSPDVALRRRRGDPHGVRVDLDTRGEGDRRVLHVRDRSRCALAAVRHARKGEHAGRHVTLARVAVRGLREPPACLRPRRLGLGELAPPSRRHLMAPVARGAVSRRKVRARDVKLSISGTAVKVLVRVEVAIRVCVCHLGDSPWSARAAAPHARRHAGSADRRPVHQGGLADRLAAGGQRVAIAEVVVGLPRLRL